MLINIQFLRFVAALLVVLYHASTHVRATGIDQGWFFASAEAVGFAGVDLFFVISGFIMVHTTLDQSGGLASIQFLKRRLARIFSGYWPFFLLAAVIFSWARPEHFATTNLLASFFLWPQPLPFMLLEVSWTLIYELYFYAVFSFLLLFGATARIRTLLIVFVAILLFNGYRHFIQQGFSPDNLYLLGFYDQFLTSPYLLEFLAGAMLAYSLKAGTKSWGWACLLLGISGFAAAGFVNVFGFEGFIERGFHVVPRVILFGLPSLLIIAGLVMLERAGTVAPVRFSLDAGGASYALYLCHTIFFMATIKLGLTTLLSEWAAWQIKGVYLLYSALLVVFSIAYFRRAEIPLHRLFKRALGVYKKPDAPAGDG